MNHGRRGLFLIINNKNFGNGGQYNQRLGSEIDTEKATKLFLSLGFEVEVGQDLRCDDMLGLMEDAANKDHSDSDCFGALLMSHGEDGEICGTDDNIAIEDLIKPFKNCPSLLGKPKLFFFQACRGAKYDPGTNKSLVESAKTCFIQRIPIEADFLYSYSTVSGYVAWRDVNSGSPYVQALCNDLSSLARTEDLLSILTHVNYRVAYYYETRPKSAGDEDDGYQQQPSIVSMLSQKLYLTPK
jgi:hypothetical protein